MTLTLGIDAQPSRIGLALVETAEVVPVWANTYDLIGPGKTRGGWTRAAMRKAAGEAERSGGTVTRLAIERGVVSYTSLDTLYDCGASYGLAFDAALLRFTDLVAHDVLRVNEWKLEALGKGKGNAPKDVVAVWARRVCTAAGWSDIQLNGLARTDATDAVGIAVASARRASSMLHVRS